MTRRASSPSHHQLRRQERGAIFLVKPAWNRSVATRFDICTSSLRPNRTTQLQMSDLTAAGSVASRRGASRRPQTNSIPRRTENRFLIRRETALMAIFNLPGWVAFLNYEFEPGWPLDIFGQPFCDPQRSDVEQR